MYNGYHCLMGAICFIYGLYYMYVYSDALSEHAFVDFFVVIFMLFSGREPMMFLQA